ncbi:hypothetical protein D1BOALGB6SA_8758 [Olavius sp. associated proteobacterium Delta 1]|nr:hypothetical protein D1BOALGB6SA_8758 [Olavius sp. associated proteobacterium Delta 1]
MIVALKFRYQYKMNCRHIQEEHGGTRHSSIKHYDTHKQKSFLG